MSGVGFPVQGTIGPAPTTSFFGAIPDRMNMLLPKHMDTSFPSSINDLTAVSANFLNQWTMYNESFAGGSNIPLMTLGGFTIAPDGTTNTAQLLVETTANSQHFCQAGWSVASSLDAGWFRIAVFVKYAGRRIVLVVSQQATAYTGGIPSNVSNARAVFDLANGQVGVQTQIVNVGNSNVQCNNWEISPAVIIAYPHGFYLCYFDVHINNDPLTNILLVSPYAWLMLDNGTGTAAESSTYAGDGVSGVYGWRSNMLPDRAWGMSGAKVFFDDMTSFSAWDLTNSKAPGFNWYIDSSTPVVPLSAVGDAPTPLADMSIAGSIFTLSGVGTGGKIDQVVTAATVNTVAPAAIVGNAWYAPALFESHLSYNYAAQFPGGTFQASFWTYDITFNANQPFQGNPTFGVPNFFIVGRELDFFEALPGGVTAYYPFSTLLSHEQTNGGDFGPFISKVASATGTPLWVSGGDYNTNKTVFNTFDSQYYISLQDANRNKRPDLNIGVWWNVYTQTTPPLVHVDFNQLHTYQNLVLPYTNNRPGQYIVFFDGVYTGLESTWAPSSSSTIATNQTLMGSNNALYAILLFAQGGMSMSVDWVSVTQ